MKHSDRVTIFAAEIWDWYARHKRELPWRDLQITNDTQRAYLILVSEIMLQQTQVPRVKIVFRNFLSSYPKVEDLAAASNAEVILSWRGMGYNSRALRLRDAAKIIVTRYSLLVNNETSIDLKKNDITSNTQPVTSNIFPREMSELLTLPGVGHYTASAIRNFAFNIPTPCIDTNIRRILHRTFVGPESSDGSWKKDDKHLLKIAAEVLEQAIDETHDTANWHAALMDFGSLVCTKRSPKWDICPLTTAGIMKAAHKVPTLLSTPKKEPGREMCGRFVPNRIFRGKIVEELRDETAGLKLEDIGSRICLDWSKEEHSKWLSGLVEKLMKDQLIEKKKTSYALAK